MLAEVLHYKGVIPEGFRAASALIDLIKAQRDEWSLSSMDMDQLKALGYIGDMPVCKADYDSIVAMQIVRHFIVFVHAILSLFNDPDCPLILFSAFHRLPTIRPLKLRHLLLCSTSWRKHAPTSELANAPLKSLKWTTS